MTGNHIVGAIVVTLSLIGFPATAAKPRPKRKIVKCSSEKDAKGEVRLDGKGRIGSISLVTYGPEGHTCSVDTAAVDTEEKFKRSRRGKKTVFRYTSRESETKVRIDVWPHGHKRNQNFNVVFDGNFWSYFCGSRGWMPSHAIIGKSKCKIHH